MAISPAPDSGLDFHNSCVGANSDANANAVHIGATCSVCLQCVTLCSTGKVKVHKVHYSRCDGLGLVPKLSSSQPSLPFLSDIHKFSIPTRKHVPVSCRNLWANVSHSFEKLKRAPGVIDNWIEVFILSQCVLRSPPRGGSRHLRYEEANAQKTSSQMVRRGCGSALARSNSQS